MSSRASARLPCARNCEYYLVTSSDRGTAIAVVEAGGEAKAREFFEALRCMLGAAPDAEVRLTGNASPIAGVPLFKATYHEALRSRAAAECRQTHATLKGTGT